MKHARADYDRIQDPAGLIPDDEPVFLIRGQDDAGAAAVYAYAAILEDMGGCPEIIAAAREHAERMRAWGKHKMPDMPSRIAGMEEYNGR